MRGVRLLSNINTRRNLSRCSNQFARLNRSSVIFALPKHQQTGALVQPPTTSRWLSSTRVSRAEDDEIDLKPDEITMKEFHALSDETLENILVHCEDLADTKPQIDVELAQGVLTLILPPNGTYVINKQPPNKQIWLSSPLSGPKRYDLIEGKWTYHRDGTTLGDLLRHEVTEALGIEATFDGVDDWSR